MELIHLNDLRFKPYITAEVIHQRIGRLAEEMNHELRHERPLFIGILNGVFMFAGELMGMLTMECEITFVKFSSYSGTSSSGDVTKLIGLNADVKGRNVVILEDIIDTGKTVSEVMIDLRKLNPASIRLATLLFKPGSLKHDLEIDYCGFEVPDDFLVGFGLDYDGLGRNLKDIHVKY